MRILVTGAGGHIGSAVVPELIQGDHEVVGLARSEASAEQIGALGADARRGDVNDGEALRDAAADVDGVIHLAFDNAAAASGDLAGAAAADRAVVAALGDVLAGTGKAFVGIGMSATGDDAVDAMVAQNPRFEVANAVMALSGREIRAALVSVPPVVHSDRDRTGFMPMLIDIARNTGRSGYIGAGANPWPAVHTLDLGRLFRLAVESARAGSQLLGAAEDDVSTREIAEAIGRGLDLPVVSIPADDAASHFGSFATIMALEFPPMVGEQTRAMLGWQPTHPGLIADLEQGHYFQAG